MNNIIYFYDKNEKYGDLSNFSPHPIEMPDGMWKTVEHYYQAKKYEGKKLESTIRDAPTPEIAAQTGRENTSIIRGDWHKVKDQIMHDALIAKFSQHEYLRLLLISTGTKTLVEHSEHDVYWGDGGNGNGLNRLGRLLMTVRTAMAQEIGHQQLAPQKTGGEFVNTPASPKQITYTWRDVFDQFNLSSNENERIADYFMELFINRSILLDDIHWLDIGCGDCKKTLLMSEAIRLKSNKKIEQITLIDSDFDLLLPLTAKNVSKIENLTSHLSFFSSCLEAQLQSDKASLISNNFITAIHCLHSKSIMKAFINLVIAKASQPDKAYLLTIFENIDSDLFGIRRILEHAGYEVPKTFPEQIENLAKHPNIDVTEAEIDGQYCAIRKKNERSIPDWIYPFVLGISLNEYELKPVKERKFIEKTITNYVLDNNITKLSIPDSAFLIKVN